MTYKDISRYSRISSQCNETLGMGRDELNLNNCCFLCLFRSQTKQILLKGSSKQEICSTGQLVVGNMNS